MTSLPDEPSFAAFYTRYAPRLWGIIRLANLPLSHSEPLLIQTLTVAWQQWALRPPAESLTLSWLIGLAHAQGLPFERVQALLRGALQGPAQ